MAPLRPRELTAALRRYYPVPVRSDASPDGPAYHGTTAELKPGDLITPGHGANFDWSSPEHVYFTDEAHYGEAVRQAKHTARRRGGTPHVYQVEPVGGVDKDPDYAISGGSYRAGQLRVIGEDELWKTDPRWPAEELPPDPGTVAIPEGHIRLWHYTSLEKVPSIRAHGLLRSKARGDAVNGDLSDPSAGVWASTKRPDGILDNHDGGAAVVEYHAHPSEISQNAEHYWHQDPQEWAKGYHHVIMRGDVPPHRIVAIHEPWHGAARYMRDDDPTLQRYQWVMDESDPVYEPYQRGLRALDRRAAAAEAAAPGNEADLADWAGARQARAEFPSPVQTRLFGRASGGQPAGPRGRPARTARAARPASLRTVR